jgi:small subunit ribosomal protein S1
VVAIGDTVRIKVLDIDRDRQRISLGLKQTQEDPWQRVISTHRPGDVLEGEVTKVVTFGAFVEILPGVEGLVHISELADHHVENPSEVVEPGTTLNVKILEIDEERRRLSLSIKRVEGQNMPMQDLGDQIAEAGNAEASADSEATGADASTTGPEADSEESASGDSVSALDPADSAPSADEAPEPDEPQDEARESDEPQNEAPEEDEAPEAAAEAEGAGPDADVAAAETSADANGGEAAEQPAEEDDGSEAHEGESVIERPDAPGGDEQADEADQD